MKGKKQYNPTQNHPTNGLHVTNQQDRNKMGGRDVIPYIRYAQEWMKWMSAMGGWVGSTLGSLLPVGCGPVVLWVGHAAADTRAHARCRDATEIRAGQVPTGHLTGQAENRTHGGMRYMYVYWGLESFLDQRRKGFPLFFLCSFFYLPAPGR